MSDEKRMDGYLQRSLTDFDFVKSEEDLIEDSASIKRKCKLKNDFRFYIESLDKKLFIMSMINS